MTTRGTASRTRDTGTGAQVRCQCYEQKLPADHGAGFIWRLYSVAKYEQRDGGTYVEVGAIAFEPGPSHWASWIVSPILRRVSRNSMLLSLQETKDAVRVNENAKPRLSTAADNQSRGATASPIS